MNAVAPSGLKAGARSGSATDDGVRLTIDYEDAGESAPASDAPSIDVAEGRKRKSPAATQSSPASDAAVPDVGLPAVPPQLAGIEVTLSVEIGNRMIALRELMSVEPGQLFALDRMTNEPVTILVNGKPFAHGEVVAMGERFGVRLLDLLPGGTL